MFSACPVRIFRFSVTQFVVRSEVSDFYLSAVNKFETMKIIETSHLAETQTLRSRDSRSFGTRLNDVTRFINHITFKAFSEATIFFRNRVSKSLLLLFLLKRQCYCKIQQIEKIRRPSQSLIKRTRHFAKRICCHLPNLKSQTLLTLGIRSDYTMPTASSFIADLLGGVKFRC